MSEITEKLKVLGERWANLPDGKEANEIADECMDMLPEVLERIEELKRGCAEMRDCIQRCRDGMRVGFKPIDAEIFDHALSTSCGSDYIHRDEVRPLVEALMKSRHAMEYYDWHKQSDHDCMEYRTKLAVEQALAHAENLSKGETK